MPGRIPFVAGAPVSGQLFINRDETLKTFYENASSGFGNILLVGPRRIGKTSVCLKLLETTSQLPDTIGSYMSMEANYERSPEDFTQAVLLNVLAKIGKVFFDKKYSDLLHDLGRGKPPVGKYRAFLRLFELARTANRKLGGVYKKDVGVSAVAKATLSEAEQTDFTVPALSSGEFLALLEEAVNMLNEQDIQKFILFVDEANKLTLESNARIIRENLSLFSAKGLQFCFVTTPEVLTVVPEAQELFHATIEIGPFRQKDCVQSLIESYVRLVPDCGVAFGAGATDAIWKLSQGLPYRVQFLCQRSFSKASGRNSPEVEVADVLEAMPENGQW